MQIIADNPSFENSEGTLLSESCSASSATLNVKNTQKFTSDDYLALGTIGTEQCEIISVTSVDDDTTLTVSATKFAHSPGDEIYEMKYNKIRFYRASSEGGAYSLQATVDVDVSNPDWVTVWEDSDGSSSNYYKIEYYHSVSTLTSSKSDPIPGGTFGRNTVRHVTDRILKEAGDVEESIIDRDEVLDWLNDCQDDVYNRRKKWWFYKRRVAAARTADQGYLSFSGDFGSTDVQKIYKIEHNLIDSDAGSNIEYRIRWLPPEEFDKKTYDKTQSTDDTTKYWTWDEAVDYIRTYPTPATSQNAAYYMEYYAIPTILDSDGDTLDIPDPKIYRYYCLHLYHLKNENESLADRYGAKYEQAITNLVRKGIRQIGQPKGFRYVKNGIYRYYIE